MLTVAVVESQRFFFRLGNRLVVLRFRLRFGVRDYLADFGFIYVGAVIFLAVAFRVVLAATSIHVSLVLALLISLLLQAICGGWFFANRATTRDGQAIGRLGGVRLSATAFLLIATVAYLFMAISHVLLPVAA